MSRWLVISDLQMPFEAAGALDFCLRVKRDLRIADENVLCVGDEVDQYWATAWPKAPDAHMTAMQEVKAVREKVREWAAAFPQMRIARSNHGERSAKRGAEAGLLPGQLVPYERFLRFPRGWRLAESWYVRCKSPWQVKHGLETGGMYAARNYPLQEGLSTAFGHLHGAAAVFHIRPNGRHPRAPGNRWGLCTGSLVDQQSYAFRYGKHSKNKAVLSIGAVVDDGLTPLLFCHDPPRGR